jgi:hypothetical protein
MAEGITNIAGIEVPSTDPIFLAVVGVHILLGLACTVTGAIAMLSQKRAGRHPRYGTIYFWCLAGIFLTASGLAASRWAEDYHLFVLGTVSFSVAYFGRQARRRRWRNWARLHITGMGTSYVLLLIAFYVDNGKQLPVWKDLPHFTYWLLPLARRDSAHRSRSVVASAGPTNEFALINAVESASGSKPEKLNASKCFLLCP